MFFFPVTLGVMSEAGKELEGAGAESDSRPQNGCAAPGGKQRAVGGDEGGCHRLAICVV